jgi:hypothetical protein
MPEQPEKWPEYRSPRPHLGAVCDALRATHGLVEPAARILGMDGGNLRAFIRRHSRCQAVQREARARILDLAESKLIQLLNDGDWRAVQFVLITLGQERGYVLKGATVNTGDVANTITIGSVVIESIPSGKFVDGDGQVIEQSVSGEIVDDRVTKKLN